MVIETRNRQIVGAGHTHETKSVKERAATMNPVTQTGSIAFFEENKEELQNQAENAEAAPAHPLRAHATAIP